MSSGIYEIFCLGSGKRYIGRAVNIADRFYKHRWNFERDSYLPNAHIQAAWNKYGADSFEFRVLEVLPNDENILIAREKFHIESAEAGTLYNKNIAKQSGRGKRSDAARRNMKLAQMAASTPERNMKISATLRGRVVPEDQRLRMIAGVIKANGVEVVLSNGVSYRTVTAFAKACGFARACAVHTALDRGHTFDQIAKRRGLL